MRTCNRCGLFRGLLVIVLLAGHLLWAGVSLAAPAAQERIPLHYGDTVTGTIDTVRFFQQYTFSGMAGDMVVITMEAVSGNLDPLLLLGDADLNLIAEDDDGAGGFDARLEVVLPASGTYVIEATRYGQDTEAGQSSGDYRLTLLANQVAAQRGSQPAGLLTPLSFGNTVRGVLSPADRFHLFWFQGQTGDEVVIQSALNVGITATLTLFDSGFSPVQEDASGRQLQASLEADGLYFVGLSMDAAAEGGAYALTLSGVAGGVQTTLAALPLAYGDQLQGVITDENPADRYVFQGQANEQVVLQMAASEGDLDSFLYLYGPQGEIVGQDDDSGSGSDAELAAVLPSDGSYTVVAARFGRENGSTGGAYTLTLSGGSGSGGEAPAAVVRTQNALPPDFAELPRLHYGDTVGGEITGADYYRAYIFEAAAGDEVVLTMENRGGDLDPLVILLDSGLNTIAEHDDIVSGENRNARLEFTIPAAGFYAVLATRFEGETGFTTGDFRLSLFSPNAASRSQIASLLPAERLTTDEAAQGRIGDTVVLPFTFYAAAGDRLELDLSANGPLQDESLLILTDADLRELAVSTSGVLQYEAPEDGQYIVLVSHQGGVFGMARGFFDLSLFGAEEAVSERLGVPPENPFEPGSLLSYGTVLTAEISDATPEITYRFTAQQGDRVTIQMTALEATLDPLLILQGPPDGEELISDDDSGGDLNALIGAYLLTDGGEYTIVATRPGGVRGSSRGTFELRLTAVPVTAETGEASGVDSNAAIPIAAGQTIMGRIDEEHMAAFYVLHGQAGQTYEIDMVRTSDDLDAFVALLDASQALIASDDDGGSGQNARLRYTLPADGVYYIVTTRFELTEGRTTGDYLLSLLLR